METIASTPLEQLKAFLMPTAQTDHISWKFGRRICELRTARGFSPAQLGARCGLTARDVIQFETNQRVATLADLELFAHGFQMSISGLLKGL